ncbi:5036_t:CDS:2 [Dentiscutata erythropus]|uniref:5036_t:CDS:1 n=1 Tax=Dentiscutata erythropus TaxID=1348616 RepID=A0A9N9DB80_9GLOM|nr:5036_t:CDS:2 [Dentiscutata erythropus]
MEKFCTNLRKSAKEERVLLHYNGHGVPKSTPSGEIWCFNFTQYIPVSLGDLQSWLGSLCIYVENNRPESSIPLNIQLAACDLFTSCLTSPIEIALRWIVLQNPLPSYLTVDMVMKLPGRLQDRRIPLGELNWIFTAITDTNDNETLSMSHPELPPTHDHSMWDSWDLAVDMCLAQLPALLSAENGGTEVEYKHSTFFGEQLTAFQVWLSKGSVSQKPPEQLPIVLQVLLSQVHRPNDTLISLVLQHNNLGPGKMKKLVKTTYNIVTKQSEKFNSAVIYDKYGFKPLERSYLLRIDEKVVERPQYMLMRVAVCIHGEDFDAAIKSTI